MLFRSSQNHNLGTQTHNLGSHTIAQPDQSRIPEHSATISELEPMQINAISDAHHARPRSPRPRSVSFHPDLGSQDNTFSAAKGPSFPKQLVQHRFTNKQVNVKTESPSFPAHSSKPEDNSNNTAGYSGQSKPGDRSPGSHSTLTLEELQAARESLRQRRKPSAKPMPTTESGPSATRLRQWLTHPPAPVATPPMDHAQMTHNGLAPDLSDND